MMSNDRVPESAAADPATAASPRSHTLPDDPQRAAVLLVAHGSRRSEANAELVKLAEMVRQSADYPIVAAAYLELAEPSIPAGIAQCVARGASQILLLPFFLSPGRHVVEDLEAFRQQAAVDHPQVPVRVCGHLGLHPLIVQVVLDRLREAHCDS